MALLNQPLEQRPIEVITVPLFDSQVIIVDLRPQLPVLYRWSDPVTHDGERNGNSLVIANEN